MSKEKKQLEELERLLKELENKNRFSETINSKVSKAAVGWHIEHILLALNKIIKALERSNPTEYRPKLSFAKFFVFTFNKIPRGIAKAPANVWPVEKFSSESTRELFKTSYLSLRKLSALQKDNYFEHPYFGKINLKPAIKFLRIHTKHHLKIIDDILKPANE